MPRIAELASASLELLADGPLTSKAMRSVLAPGYGISATDAEWPRFVNGHAWALVRLQEKGLIRKVAPRTYQLLCTPTIPDTAPLVTPLISPMQPLPDWARITIRAANSRNRDRWNAEQFSESDLQELWQQQRQVLLQQGL